MKGIKIKNIDDIKELEKLLQELYKLKLRIENYLRVGTKSRMAFSGDMDKRVYKIKELKHNIARIKTKINILKKR